MTIQKSKYSPPKKAPAVQVRDDGVSLALANGRNQQVLTIKQARDLAKKLFAAADIAVVRAIMTR